MNNPILVTYRLAGPEGDGLGPYVNDEGAFLGLGTPLLESSRDRIGRPRWEPRSQAELEPLLSLGYGMPIDLTGRIAALRVVADALSSGNKFRAGIGLLQARLPALPDSAAARRMAEADSIAKYSPLQPRIPKGEQGGGQWTREGASAGTKPTRETHRRPPVTPAQAIILEPPILRPFPIPMNPPAPFGPRPLPPSIPVPYRPPPPLENPFPDDADCAEEWAHAEEYCDRLRRNRLLGREPYRGMGRSYAQCLMGEVSERCGGNPVA